MSIKPPPEVLQERGMTCRKWKAHKRRQLRAIKKAVEEYRYGCAYVPSGVKRVDQLNDILDQMAVELSIDVWGR